jgi:[acyl-carrier-protein] S-malonyltransferase
MGADIVAHSPAAKAVFDQAEALRPGLTELCFNGPADQLNQTINTQPALFIDDLACANALIEAGVTPEGVAGFSLGEVVACVLAGVMSAEQAFDFVTLRAAAMQDCNERHPGTMFAVVKLTPIQVDQVAAAVGLAWPVNYNCPGQVVVACDESVADALAQAVKQAGGRAIRLAVGGAFHSPLMDEAVPQLAAWLDQQQFGDPTIPIFANATAAPYEPSNRSIEQATDLATDPSILPATPAKLLSYQVNHPVLWQKSIEAMIADGFDCFIEVGPGKTLSGFIKKINPDVAIHNVADAASLATTLEALK